MDDLHASGKAGKRKAKPSISAAEIERRRAHVRIADAENRIEGITRDPSSDPIFEAYIRGEIEVRDMVPLYKAQLTPG